MARKTKKTTRKKAATRKSTRGRPGGGARSSRDSGSAVRRRRTTVGEELTLGAWRVPKTLLERLNAASYWGRVSAASIVREALDTSLKKLEKKNGGSFPMPPRRG